jgi:DNA-binding transcriptional LysR family regulator
VASPEYLAEMGTPQSVKELRHHRCLAGFARGELPEATWPAGRGVVRIEAVFSSNDLMLLREAALAGLGIALLPMLVIADALDGGALVPVLPGVLETENRAAVVYVERELVAPQVRAFIDAMLAWAPTLERQMQRQVARRSTRR